MYRGELKALYILTDPYLSHIETAHQDRTGVTIISYIFEYTGQASINLVNHRCEQLGLHMTDNPEQTFQKRRWEIIEVRVGLITVWTNHPQLSDRIEKSPLHGIHTF